jgi:hypothetical protein
MSAERAKRLPLILLALVALLALSACGSDEGLDVDEGVPVELGPLEYNVLYTRFLNPADVEDSGYLVGQPDPGADAKYLGVFLLVTNHADEPVSLPSELTIVNTDHKELPSLDSASDFALPLGSDVPAHQQVPVRDSTAAAGPTQGSLVVFLVSDAYAENRPINLIIPGGEEGDAEVKLDL